MVACGAVQKKPIVNDKGEIEVGNIMVMNANNDHRYGDAGLFAPAFYVLMEYLKDPAAFKPEEHLPEKEWPEKKMD
jgi:pyruvate/2-oxoglutarate dehydrogenase complex dihydrolipoamide acyltransferase (E2) component